MRVPPWRCRWWMTRTTRSDKKQHLGDLPWDLGGKTMGETAETQEVEENIGKPWRKPGVMTSKLENGMVNDQ